MGESSDLAWHSSRCAGICWTRVESDGSRHHCGRACAAPDLSKALRRPQYPRDRAARAQRVIYHARRVIIEENAERRRGDPDRRRARPRVSPVRSFTQRIEPIATGLAHRRDGDADRDHLWLNRGRTHDASACLAGARATGFMRRCSKIPRSPRRSSRTSRCD